MAELKQLQVKLKELDQKAGLIELDLRNAMDQGKIFLIYTVKMRLTTFYNVTSLIGKVYIYS